VNAAADSNNSPADPEVRRAVMSFLQRQSLQSSETLEQYCSKFVVKSGTTSVPVSVFNSGKIVVGGKDSALKKTLDSMKAAIESGQATPGQALPFEIDKFPETIQQRVPGCDPIIIRFVSEAIACLRADALLGAAFMLGAASERAISLMIQAFADAIVDEQNRARFTSRVNSRLISAKFDEFTRSFKSCKSRPTSGVLAQDIDVVIGAVFQFCRITRNEVGHPQIVPDLDRGVVIANLGHFVTYVERVHRLMEHFKQVGVTL